MAQSELIGFVRKSNNGNALKLSISTDAFQNAKKYAAKDGKEYVGLIVNVDKIREIIDGNREVTSICQIVN